MKLFAQTTQGNTIEIKKISVWLSKDTCTNPVNQESLQAVLNKAKETKCLSISNNILDAFKLPLCIYGAEIIKSIFDENNIYYYKI
ncbi:MAG: hypothetical protein WC389_14985 [Lutibacter sp.]|jgi:hypothetical protein